MVVSKGRRAAVLRGGTRKNATVGEDRRRARHDQDRLQRVLDGLFAFVGLLTLDGVLVEANRAPLQAAELTRDQVIGRPFIDAWWFCHSPALQAQVRNCIQRAARGEAVREDLDARVAGGRIINVDASFSPIRDGDGHVVEIVVSGVDVTDRRRGETALRESEERLRQAQKMEAVGRLAGGVAHDFNNLLTAIVGYSELALERLEPAHPVRADIDEIRKASESAASLTRQLLAFSRRQPLQPQPLDLNAVVRRVQTLLRRTIGEDVRLIARLEPALDAVSADPGQMEQVLMNLAVNARDAMPDGGRLTIETANVEMDEATILSCAGAASSLVSDVAQLAGTSFGATVGPTARGAAAAVEASPARYVRVSVSDTGVGMNDEVQSHLFEPFFTTKELGRGTGLGLATVYGIVSQSGGFVCVQSAPGRGSTFGVFLPRAAAPVTPARPVRPAPTTRAGIETVLLVEDETAVRAVSKAVLVRSGYTVFEAPDGDAALRMLRQYAGHIDLLVTDVVMPGLNGFDLATRVLDERPLTRVLYVSGYVDRALPPGVPWRGPFLWLQKPFTPDELLQKVRAVLDASP